MENIPEDIEEIQRRLKILNKEKGEILARTDLSSAQKNALLKSIRSGIGGLTFALAQHTGGKANKRKGTE